MCRIAGVITNRPQEAATDLLSSMIGSMLHDRCDSYGTYAIPELGCYLGWVADPDAGTDLNPAVSRDEERIAVLAGEQFSDAPGAKSPAARFLAMWNEDGERSLRDLNGWFAGVLVDLTHRRIVLFNDRYGLHRIYWTQTSDGLLFASEAKALLTVEPKTRQLNPERLGEYVAFGSVPNDRTLFENVALLPGGSMWSIKSPAEIEKRRYFSADEWEQQTPLSGEDFYDALKATMSSAVRRHFGGSASVAVSLTGGLDTRAIMAFAKAGQGKRASYTFGGMYRDCYDVQIAGQVARACGYDHHVLRLGPEFLRHFADYAERTVWLTDGTLDLGATHEVYLNGLARTIAPVRVTGNYGSEVLRGASTFKQSGISTDLFTPAFVPYIVEANRSFDDLKRGHQVTVAAFREIPWHLFGRLNAAQSQLTVRSPYTDNALVALAYRAPADVRKATGLWNRLIFDGNATLASIPTDRGHVGTRSELSTLPYRLYNHLLFKAEWYHEAGMPDWLARVERRLPETLRPLPFVGVHKIEQYRMWFRNELHAPLRAIVDLTAKDSPYLHAGRAKEMLSQHRDGSANFVTEIQRIASIALIEKLFVTGFKTARHAQSIRVAQINRSPRQHSVVSAAR